MTATTSIKSLLPVVAVAVALTGCIKGKRNNIEQETEAPVSPVSDEPITVTKSEKGLLDVTVTIRDDGMLLNVKNIPEGATLECDLDDKPLVPCHDGAFFLRPAAGDHIVAAVALKDGSLVSVGESRVFTVSPVAQDAIDNAEQGSLVLMLDDAGFTNAAPLPVNADFKAKFKYVSANQPKDCKPQLRCKYDSRTSQFWTSCDLNSSSYTVSKDLMAIGLQYLSVQATCADRVGPIFTMFWYGVPESYKPMMLQAVRDQSGRAFVSLIRDADCPEGQQIFECAADATAPFVKCETGNSIAAPQKGYRVRLQCDSQTGPEYTFE
jgi:hypothetical protein